MEHLKKIIDLIKSNNLSNLEKERLNNDLETIFLRLSKKEYLKTDFSKNNKFNIPERTNEYFSYTKSYCDTGKTISKILNRLEVNRYNKVVDLCSGWAPKVLLGYYYSEYKGEIILVDKDKKLSQKAIDFMQLFYPKYNMHSKELDLFNNFNFKSDFIVANHVIDDLIMSYFCDIYNLDQSLIYKNEHYLVDYRKNIISHGEEFKNKIINKLVIIIDKLLENNGKIVLTQYQSMIEKLLNLDKVTDYNLEVMNKVKSKLLEKNYLDITEDSCQDINSTDSFKKENIVVLLKKT